MLLLSESLALCPKDLSPRILSKSKEPTDLDGNRFVEEREGLNARVILHESDHLNGVLHIDRLPPAIRKKIVPQLQVIKKKYFLKK